MSAIFPTDVLSFLYPYPKYVGIKHSIGLQLPDLLNAPPQSQAPELPDFLADTDARPADCEDMGDAPLDIETHATTLSIKFCPQWPRILI
jgi:hypothetical protein